MGEAFGPFFALGMVLDDDALAAGLANVVSTIVLQPGVNATAELMDHVPVVVVEVMALEEAPSSLATRRLLEAEADRILPRSSLNSYGGLPIFDTHQH